MPQRTNGHRIARALAGPLLIVVASLVAMHGYAFGGKLSAAPDDLSFWLPNDCYLGHALRSGHIPIWNPTTLAGTPFAADPQTGWMYLPVMVLFTVLPCGSAMRWFLVLQPIGAGLGIYWFLRGEGISRVAATAGGLALALPIAASIISVSIPFAATFAWSALTLAAASRLLHARRWPARFLWILATVIAWGQLAAAHLSFGLLIGTGALAAYVTARFVTDLRADRERGRRTLVSIGLLVLAFPLVNAAYLIPRLAYLPRTTLGLGYERIQQLSTLMWRQPWDADVWGAGIDPARPLGFSGSPGHYLGAAMLLLGFGGLFAKRTRPLAIAFALFGAAFYVGALKFVAIHVGPHIVDQLLGATYLHEPRWLEFALILALPVLGALGIDAWLGASSMRRRLLMLAPGVAVWLVLPLLFGSHHGYTVLFAIGSLVALVALAVIARWPAVAMILPVIVAAELVANVFIGEAGIHAPPGAIAIGPRPVPRVSTAAFLAEGPISRALAGAPGRYLTIAPDDWVPIGLQTRQSPGFWPMLAMQQSLTFGLRSAQGYDPIQELGYWEFVRAAGHTRLKYNVSYFKRYDPLVADLLQVSDLIGRTGAPPAPGMRRMATEGSWSDYRFVDPVALASLVPTWSVDGSTERAISTVAARSFSPEQHVLVDRAPVFGTRPDVVRPTGPASASVTSLQPERVALSVNATADAVVLVRQPYAPGWRATVDGHPAPVLRADGFLQGIAVAPGRHTIELRYVEPTIALGLLVSLLAICALLAAAGWTARATKGSDNAVRST